MTEKNQTFCSEQELVSLSRIVNLGRQFLLADRLVNGAWGRTIGTYMEKAQPAGTWSRERLESFASVHP